MCAASLGGGEPFFAALTRIHGLVLENAHDYLDHIFRQVAEQASEELHNSTFEQV